MSTLRLGPIRSLFLLGGGDVLVKLAQETRAMGLQVRILTAPRLANETVATGENFESALRRTGLPVEVISSLDANRSPFTELDESTLGISLGAAWIFREDLIRRFQGRLLNCHGSCLPEDRGGGGFSWRILRDDRRGRCLLHQVDVGVDSGPILCSRDYRFPDSCRIPRDFFQEQRARDFEFLADFMKKAAAGCVFELQAQDHSRSTYWPRLDTALHAAIDWNWPAAEVERFIRAFDEPYGGAYTYLNGHRVRLKGCFPVQGEPVFHPFQAGLVYRIHQEQWHVACVGGNLRIERMLSDDAAEDPLTLLPGDRLWTPASVLEQARTTRVIHTVSGPRYQHWATVP